MAMKALTTLEALKVTLGLADSDSSSDALLIQLIEAVSSAVRRRTGRDFVSAERTEYLDGNGQDAIYLRHRPVTAVAGVWLDAAGYMGQASGAFAASTLMTAGTDYYVDNLEANERNPGRLVLITNPFSFGYLSSGDPVIDSMRARWPIGQGNIKVTYTGGYREMPADIEGAVHALVQIIRGGISQGSPLKSETLGRYSYELLSGMDLKGSNAELVAAKSIIASYAECPL